MSTSARLMKARDILQKAHERRYAIEQGVDGMPLELREAYRAEEQAKMAYGAAKAALYREEAERIAATDPEYRRLYRRAEAYRATLAKVAGVRALVRKAATEARRPTGFFGELGETGDGVYGAIRSGLFWGAVGAVREVIERMSADLPQQPHVFVTGGDLRHLAPLVSPHSQFVPNMVLSGIAIAAGERGASAP